MKTLMKVAMSMPTVAPKKPAMPKPGTIALPPGGDTPRPGMQASPMSPPPSPIASAHQKTTPSLGGKMKTPSIKIPKPPKIPK